MFCSNAVLFAGQEKATREEALSSFWSRTFQEAWSPTGSFIPMETGGGRKEEGSCERVTEKWSVLAL